MNLVTRFLDSLGERALGTPASRPSWVVATPSFPTSRNVVYLIAPAGTGRPTLVAKVSRRTGRDEALCREAANLEALESLAGGSPATPQLIEHQIYFGHEVLLETAVAGRPINQSFVRNHPHACLDAVMRQLEHLHHATASERDPRSRAELIDRPLRRLEAAMGSDDGLLSLVDRVRREVDPARSRGVPAVFEHGDTSAPNLLLQDDGQAGLVDFELSTPRGLPALDVFFFLNFVSVALNHARSPAECLRAFRSAFFGPSAWAGVYVTRFADRVGIPRSALRPLFLLCWTRYLAEAVSRHAWALGGERPRVAIADLTRDRYWELWRYAVEHADELECFA